MYGFFVLIDLENYLNLNNDLETERLLEKWISRTTKKKHPKKTNNKKQKVKKKHNNKTKTTKHIFYKNLELRKAEI